MSDSSIIIRGRRSISGSIQIAGAKNSVLKLMAASLLAEGVTHITNVPNISDVSLMADVLRKLGANVEFENSTLAIDTSTVNSTEAPYELVSKMRASIAVLGPLIGRFKRATVAIPGGCQIGSRKLDMHLEGLQQLGVRFQFEHGNIIASVPSGLKGANVALEFPSVGATENLMIAAAAADGQTIITNVAREPEIVDLANFLNSMGAKITGQGSDIMSIQGVGKFKPVSSYATVGDRIEAGTFLVAGALSGTTLTLEGINPDHLQLPIHKLSQMGAQIITGSNSITVSGCNTFKAVDFQTLPYPGFPTDLQAQFMVVNAIADGDSVITENVFENRFTFVDELSRMGADISVFGHHAHIKGVSRLSGAPVKAPDLRAGAALIIAGLIADGTTTIGSIEHIDRGYEHVVEKLKSIGAEIERFDA